MKLKISFFITCIIVWVHNINTEKITELEFNYAPKNYKYLCT